MGTAASTSINIPIEGDENSDPGITRTINAAVAKAEDEDEDEDPAGNLATDKIEAEVAAVRGLIVSGGFGALDARLRELVTQANKPPVEVRIEVPVEVPASGGTKGAAPSVRQAKCTGKDETWRQLFGVKGALGQRTTKLWDGAHPDTPGLNPRYVWPQPATAIALTQVARKRNVLLFGAAGTGKTEWSQQLAARTGRPFALISCDSTTDGPTLVGMTVPAADGSVAWQDGQLTRAIQTPGCVICIDEPSVARPGALFVLQNVLANRVLFIAETGRRVKVAEGVVFISCDNTNGTGGGSRRGYTDTNRLNAAFLDRFGVRVRFDFMPADQERDILVSYTGCTPALAELLISAAATTRAAAEGQQLTAGIGLRRLLSWAELLTDGIDAEDAFHAAVLNCASEQDVETLRQQCLLAYDKTQVAAALNNSPVDVTTDANPDPALTNATAAGRDAASQFQN
jgi:cobaltochelatase CobS